MRAHLAHLALLLLPFVAACRADEPMSAVDVPSDATALRVVNAAARPVDLIIDGQVVLSSIGASSIAPRIALPAGLHVVKLRTAGGSNGTGAGSSITVTAVAGQTATVAALPAAADSVSVTALADSGAAPVAGQSKLRVIHLAASAPAIDVWRTQPDYQTPIRVMFPFAYRAQSSYLQSTPGVWVVWVTPADATAPTLASSGSVTVGAGEVRTLVILDAPGGGVQVKPLE